MGSSSHTAGMPREFLAADGALADGRLAPNYCCRPHSIAGVHPDFVFILALNCGFDWRANGWAVGRFGRRVFVDIINGRLLGLNALTIALVAYLAGLAERKVYKDSIPMLAAFTFMGTVAQQSFFMGFCGFSMCGGGRAGFAYHTAVGGLQRCIESICLRATAKRNASAN